MARSSQRFAKRVQTMVTKRQYELLQECARRAEKPVGVVVREVLERILIKDLDRRQKEEALERLLSGNAPVGDWSEMEKQIEKRREGCLKHGNAFC